MNVEDLAKVCHEANRAYCQSLGDNSQPPWEDVEDWQRQSILHGVQIHLETRLLPRESHQIWLEEKLSTGWSYGPVKDVGRKLHPCCVHYDDLPEEQCVKDYLFSAIVQALKPITTFTPLPDGQEG
jgi:hypothetical protein